jgi:hypothetical protein
MQEAVTGKVTMHCSSCTTKHDGKKLFSEF